MNAIILKISKRANEELGYPDPVDVITNFIKEGYTGLYKMAPEGLDIEWVGIQYKGKIVAKGRYLGVITEGKKKRIVCTSTSCHDQKVEKEKGSNPIRYCDYQEGVFIL